MRYWLLLTVTFFLLTFNRGFAQRIYHHNISWGRLTLTDTITSKLRWELYIQHRRQNGPDNELDVFKVPQFTSYWAWLNYTLTPTTRLGVSPFGYFKSWLLIAQPSDLDKDGVRELRWSIRLDQEQKLAWFNLINRYGLEYRWRDLSQTNVFVPNWRARYMLRLEKPMKIAWLKRPITLVVNDELFVQFGRAVRGNPNVFDQNRFYAGFNVGLSRSIKASLGYMYGIQQRISGKEFDRSNFLWGVLTIDNALSRFKKK